MKNFEKEEKLKLGATIKILKSKRTNYTKQLERKRQEIKEDTVYRGEARSDMDHGEKITIRQIIEEKVIQGEQIKQRIKKIDKLIDSPYFGRIDFKKNNNDLESEIYIGIYNYYDFEKVRPIIHDWRAPISSMFYNHEIGPADYEGPSGIIKGQLSLKRQFRIRNQEMEFALESSVNIVDDVLQKELSRNSDEGMKNIVATIQRDQNTIIRNEDSPVLIIQGAAGSGKTSIALHRIAFLLYRHKKTLTSDDILIISPNKVFSDYISNVLPELGEEKVGEMQMEELAKNLLGKEFRFESFFEQNDKLLEEEDEQMKKRIKTKTSLDFLKKIDEYASQIKKTMFLAKDINIGGCFVPAWLLEEVFEINSMLPRKDCIREIVKTIKQKIDLEYNYTLNTSETAELKKIVQKMNHGQALIKTYADMFVWMGTPDLFKKNKDGKLEYADVFPLLYLKICLEADALPLRKAKHLLIDEMQDYTPIQYAVIARLFKCNKTILGDANQSVNPYSSSNAQAITQSFPKSCYVQLNKSYRSTYEIMNFVQKISHNPELEAMKRHGEKPRLIGFQNKTDEEDEICRLAESFIKSKFNTLGIICKTQKQAESVYSILQKKEIDAKLLSNQSAVFGQGITICNAHLAKGLEFDEVIIPNTSSDNFSTEMDKGLLYVACTRAMHKLTLTYCGKQSSLISD